MLHTSWPGWARNWTSARRVTLLLISAVTAACGLGALYRAVDSGSLASLDTHRLAALATLIIMPWIALALARTRSLTGRA